MTCQSVIRIGASDQPFNKPDSLLAPHSPRINRQRASATARLNLNHRVTPRLHKSSYKATLSPVIESIGRYCLLREPKMRQSRRIFLARLGAVALAAQARSFHALSKLD